MNHRENLRTSDAQSHLRYSPPTLPDLLRTHNYSLLTPQSVLCRQVFHTHPTRRNRPPRAQLIRGDSLDFCELFPLGMAVFDAIPVSCESSHASSKQIAGCRLPVAGLLLSKAVVPAILREINGGVEGRRSKRETLRCT